MGQHSIQRKFIYIALIFGVLLIMLVPPFQAPDEDSHFKKAYVMAEGNFFVDVVDGKKGYYLSETVIDYIAEQRKSLGNMEYKFSYGDVVDEERTSVVYQNQVFTQFSTMETNPVGHIIPAVGIIIGKLTAIIAGIEPSVVFLLFFARLFSLLAYVTMIGWAIRMTPVLKITFSMLGLMPMSLFLSSTVSYDMLLIGVSFLYTALCFKLLYNPKEKVNIKQLLFIGMVVFVFFSIKIVYLPLILLFFVILLREKECSKRDIRKYVVRCGIVVGVFAFLFLITIFLPKVLGDKIQIVNEATPSLAQQQIVFILKNPIEFLKILYYEIKSRRNYYISTTIGIFGLVDTPMYSVFIYMYAFVVGVMGIFEISVSEIRVNWYHRVAVLLGVVAGVFGSFLAMYIYWTPIFQGVGSKGIEGVQGRYFIPSLPIAFLSLKNSFVYRNRCLRRIATETVSYGAMVSVTMLGVSVLTILLRYWV